MRLQRRLRAVLAAALAAAALPAGLAAEPLALEAARTLAASRSGTLAAARFEIDRASAAVKETRTKAMPQLSLTGSASYMTNPPKGITISQGAFGFAPAVGSQYPVAMPDQDYVIVADTEPTYFKTQASLDQVVCTWGKIEKAIEIAKLDLSAAQVSSVAQGRKLSGDVASAYFGAELARDSLALLVEAKGILDGAAADRQSAFDAGTVTRAEVLDAQSKAAQLGYQVVKARENLETCLGALEFYLGYRPAAEDLVTPFRDAAPELDEAALTAKALATSTDVQSLSIKASQAKLARQIRQASLMGIPDFSLNVTYDLTGQKIPFVAGNWTDSFSGDLIITIAGKVTLFDSLASINRLDQARAQEAEALVGLDELRRGTGLQLRRLVEAARTNAALVVQASADEELADERARAAGVALENESITRAEEGGARAGAISAKLSLLLARFQTETALLELERQTGGEFPRATAGSALSAEAGP